MVFGFLRCNSDLIGIYVTLPVEIFLPNLCECALLPSFPF